MRTYKTMEILSLKNVDTFFEPADPKEATKDSPAMDVVTDFHYTRPLILDSDVGVDEAIRMLEKAHVHMKLVVDHNEHFLGIVTTGVLQGQPVLRTAQQTGIARADLTVADVMIKRDKLHALSYDELQRSTVGDVLHTLGKLGEWHILVVDRQNNRICGVVSASDVAQFLHAPVQIMHRAASFVDVFDALSH